MKRVSEYTVGTRAARRWLTFQPGSTKVVMSDFVISLDFEMSSGVADSPARTEQRENVAKAGHIRAKARSARDAGATVLPS